MTRQPWPRHAWRVALARLCACSARTAAPLCEGTRGAKCRCWPTMLAIERGDGTRRPRRGSSSSSARRSQTVRQCALALAVVEVAANRDRLAIEQRLKLRMLGGGARRKRDGPDTAERPQQRLGTGGLPGELAHIIRFERPGPLQRAALDRQQLPGARRREPPARRRPAAARGGQWRGLATIRQRARARTCVGCTRPVSRCRAARGSPWPRQQSAHATGWMTHRRDGSWGESPGATASRVHPVPPAAFDLSVKWARSRPPGAFRHEPASAPGPSRFAPERDVEHEPIHRREDGQNVPPSWAGQDSNLRRTDYESAALTN
jgi:hypothetical protein